MEKIINYKVLEIPDSSMTVGRFLQNQGFSNHIITHLKQAERGILVNGHPSWVNRSLFPGDLITVLIKEETGSPNIIPVPMELHVVYEDEDLLVINKAAGVPIHPSQGNFDNTLANAVCYYFQQKGESFVYRAINRLDRDTTGLLILAKHMLSACKLSQLVKDRAIKREYLAIASGKTEKRGAIEAPIARVPGSTIERQVNFTVGQPACTHYRRIIYCQEKDISLVSLRLETGRTHQIRVHLKYIGHPLPGDFLYHPDFSMIRRQALHSFRLTFPHPLTGEVMHFSAPLPEDMRSCFL